MQKSRVSPAFSLNFSKFLGITAEAAQLLRGLSAAEAFGHRFGPGRLQHLGQFLGKYIAQIDGAFAVQAAGHYRSIAEDAEMIP